MEKRIIIYNDQVDNIIINGSEPLYYKLHSGRLNESFDIEKLLSDDKYFNNVLLSGYDSYEKEYLSDYDSLYRRIFKKFYIPLSKNFIEFYKLNWDDKEYRKGYITLSNTHLDKENVDAFYEFSLSVEIEGLRINNSVREFIENKIEFRCPQDNEEQKDKMIKLFGEPQVHPQNMDDKYGRFVKDYFFVDKARIDKFIGIKRYRDISTIGQVNGEQFTGESEEFILDPHNFDKDVYTIFEENGIIGLKE